MSTKVTVETTIAAAVERVWSAYTTPGDIKRWNAASTDWHTTAASVDLREGGAFSSRMEAKDGSMGFDFAGTYTRIVAHKLIEYTFGDRRTSVVFAETARGVSVTISFDPETTHPLEQQRQGWQAILNSFARYVEAGCVDPSGARVGQAKNTICLWFERDAEGAARFYAETFPDSSVGAIFLAPGDFPSGKKGDVLSVQFTVLGIPCLGINGGPAFKQSEAFSFQIATDTQEETDRYWNAIIGNGGQESACGWCKDRWGLSWQITPRALMEALAAGGSEAKRAFDAMMTMGKIDVAAIEAARRG